MATSPYLQHVPERRPASARDVPQPGEITRVGWQDMIAEVSPWDRLAAKAVEPNPFYESWYLLPSLHNLGDKQRISVLRFDRAGELAGLLPIERSFRYYHLMIPNIAGWIHANCFLGTPLVASGSETAFWRALLSWVDANAGFALFFHLRSLPLGGVVHRALNTVLADDCRLAACVHREQRAMLSSQADADTYWQESLSAKKRKELKRQLNRLREEGNVEFRRETGDQDLHEWIAAFLALEASGWKGRAGSALASDPATEALFRESLEGAAARGKLERLSLLLDGRPIAMLATFLSPPGAFSYKTAFDERYARFSPGVLLQQENLALLGHEDIAWCDSCAAADHPMIDHIWRERRQLGRLSIAIGGPLRRALFSQIAARETAGMPKETR